MVSQSQPRCHPPSNILLTRSVFAISSALFGRSVGCSIFFNAIQFNSNAPLLSQRGGNNRYYTIDKHRDYSNGFITVISYHMGRIKIIQLIWSSLRHHKLKGVVNPRISRATRQENILFKRSVRAMVSAVMVCELRRQLLRMLKKCSRSVDEHSR
jgi:hypothetical protein